MNKKLLSIILLGVLSINTASAELVNAPLPNANDKTSENLSAVNIIENLTNAVDLSTYKYGGTLKEGVNSMVVAYAYLTPQRDFGYIYTKDFDASNTSGTTVSARDDFGKSWNMSNYPESSYPQAQDRLLKIATNYISNSSFFTDRLAQVNDKNYKDMYLQYDSTRKQYFVASTLYVRWLYDVGCTGIGHTDDSHTGMFKKVPVLTDTGGPYIATGERMDTDPDVFTNPSQVSTIRNNKSTRVTTFKNALGGPVPNYPHLNNTEYNCWGDVISGTGRAFFEKRYEVRRYINDNVSDSFEVVIPKKTTTVSTQTAIPKVAPSVSVTSNVHLNSTSTAVDKYTFDIKISSKSPAKNYSSAVSETYSQPINKDGSLGTNPAATKEPSDTQMDIWHHNLVPVFEILDADGNVVTLYDKSGNKLSPKTISAGNTTITIPQSSIDISLNNHTARVTLKYSSSIRYLSYKKTLELSYSSNTNSALKDKTYSQIINYIDSTTGNNNNKNPIKTEISNGYTAVNPRIERVFKTSTKDNLSTQASDSISAYIPEEDNTPPTVKLEVTPPNTLTILEGASFDIELDASIKGKDPNLTVTGPGDYKIDKITDIPQGEVGEHRWVDNFKIDKVEIIAQNGDEIPYNQNQVSIDTSNPNKFIFKINGMTANPQHIGIANVKIYYSYDLNHRTWQTVPSTTLKDDGTPEYWNLYTNTTTTPQKGDINKNFKIYSLSGNTMLQ